MRMNTAYAAKDRNGFRVEIVLSYGGTDDTADVIQHFALFMSKLDADALADRINAARRAVQGGADRGIDVTKWTWPGSRAVMSVWETAPRAAVRTTYPYAE